jgi:hypothetical protein
LELVAGATSSEDIVRAAAAIGVDLPDACVAGVAESLRVLQEQALKLSLRDERPEPGR